MRLQRIGQANLLLGTVSLVRLVTEILFFWTIRDLASLGCFAAFDAAVASLWVLGGLFLLSHHEWALSTTAMAAGAAAARTIISGMLLGPRMAEHAWGLRTDPEFERVLCAVASRFLHYGIEFVYWPVVLFVILRAADAPQPRRQPDSEWSTGCAFAATGVIASIAQVVLIDPLG